MKFRNRKVRHLWALKFFTHNSSSFWDRWAVNKSHSISEVPPPCSNGGFLSFYIGSSRVTKGKVSAAMVEATAATQVTYDLGNSTLFSGGDDDQSLPRQCVYGKISIYIIEGIVQRFSERSC